MGGWHMGGWHMGVGRCCGQRECATSGWWWVERVPLQVKRGGYPHIHAHVHVCICHVMLWWVVRFPLQVKQRLTSLTFGR